MELRNRAAARRDVPGPAHDVSLGPTIYAGERYSKASERLRRQNKTGVVVNGDRFLAPRLIGFGIALTVLFLVLFWIQYQGAQKRNRGQP